MLYSAVTYDAVFEMVYRFMAYWDEWKLSCSPESPFKNMFCYKLCERNNLI